MRRLASTSDEKSGLGDNALVVEPMAKNLSESNQQNTPLQSIQQRIFLIRGHRVMLSTHLASLYGVEPKKLIQAVKRNIDRFPEDFMFQLTRGEFENLKSQLVTSS